MRTVISQKKPYKGRYLKIFAAQYNNFAARVYVIKKKNELAMRRENSSAGFAGNKRTSDNVAENEPMHRDSPGLVYFLRISECHFSSYESSQACREAGWSGDSNVSAHMGTACHDFPLQTYTSRNFLQSYIRNESEPLPGAKGKMAFPMRFASTHILHNDYCFVYCTLSSAHKLKNMTVFLA